MDVGDAISVAAPLSDDELRAGLAEVSGLVRQEAAVNLADLDLADRPLRLCVVGEDLVERLRANATGLSEIDAVISESAYADAIERLR